MALRGFRVTRRTVSGGWEYAPPPGTHKLGTFPDGSAFSFEWLERMLGRDPRITGVSMVEAMRRAGCNDARACNPRIYAGDIILVDDANPKLHPTDDEGRQHDRIGTMVTLKRAWVADAAINVNSIAGTARMQRIMAGPPKDGETLPNH